MKWNTLIFDHAVRHYDGDCTDFNGREHYTDNKVSHPQQVARLIGMATQTSMGSPKKEGKWLWIHKEYQKRKTSS
jgi:hypothetical protein